MECGENKIWAGVGSKVNGHEIAFNPWYGPSKTVVNTTHMKTISLIQMVVETTVWLMAGALEQSESNVSDAFFARTNP